MKRIRNFVTLYLTAALLSVSAAAATTVPSIENKNVPTVTANDAAGNALDDGSLLVVSLNDTSESTVQIREALNVALTELRGNELTNLVPGFADSWAAATSGAPLENAVISHVFDVSVVGNADTVFANGAIDVTLKASDITADDSVVLIHKTSDGWKVEPSRRGADGEIIVTVSSLSPFAIVVDNGAAPAVDGDTKSPQTGVSTAAIVLASVSFAGAGAAFVVKSRRDD
ncbi:MAG: hypothetical protein HFE63_11405 [Clostridiales bacterium]|nr:hypothetical protein [Clostridiales bacterium]